MRKVAFAYAKMMMQISCAVTAQLIRALVFATQIHVVQIPLLKSEFFQASSHLLWQHRQVCVGLGWIPRIRLFFSHRRSLSLTLSMFFRLMICPLK